LFPELCYFFYLVTAMQQMESICNKWKASHLMLLLSSGATLVNSGAEISPKYHPSKDEAAHQTNGWMDDG